MRYLGGKFRHAKRIVDALCVDGSDVWEPFCGGCNVTAHLAQRCNAVLASDTHEALIGMYQALKGGWVPPTELNEAEYQHLRYEGKPSDPMTAFAGFGCSFAGKYFGGYARSKDKTCYADTSARSLLKLSPHLANVTFFHTSFLDMAPFPLEGAIYCDPPYAGTTGYSRTKAFDHAMFWSTCQAWVRQGVRVYVSEYKCPVGHEIVEEFERSQELRGGDGSTRNMRPLERVYKVLP